MTPAEIKEDLDEWVKVDPDGVPRPVGEWHFVNARYVVDGVPFTKPQVEAFLHGLDKGLDWVHAVAKHVGACKEAR